MKKALLILSASIVVILITLLSFSNSQKIVSPEDCGYTGTDADFYIKKALDSTGACGLLAHNYPINETIIVGNNQSIIGTGHLSSISTLSNITVLELKGNRITLENFTIAGWGGAANQIGVRIVGNEDSTLDTSYSSIRLNNIHFEQLRTVGFYTSKNVSESMQGTALVSQCSARGCEIGYWCDRRGEYNEFTGCTAFLCETGFRNKGGNNKWNGGNLTSNYTGLELIGGEVSDNDGHCLIDGTTLNHNSYPVKSRDLLNGYTISNCHIHVGKIDLNGSNAIEFKGNTLDVDSIKNGNCTGTSFDNNKFTGVLKVSGTLPKFFNNRFELGVPTGYAEYLTNPSVENGKYIYFYGNESTDGSYRLGMLNDSYVNQIRISGEWITITDFTAKGFPDSEGRQFVDVENKVLKNNAGHSNIRLNSNWMLFNGYLRYDWYNQLLFDQNQVLSGSFIDRTLNDNSGATSVDYQGKKLYGDWKIKSPDGTWWKIKVDNSGNLYTE
jgi:hypothetical protein